MDLWQLRYYKGKFQTYKHRHLQTNADAKQKELRQDRNCMGICKSGYFCLETSFISAQRILSAVALVLCVHPLHRTHIHTNLHPDGLCNSIASHTPFPLFHLFHLSLSLSLSVFGKQIYLPLFVVAKTLNNVQSLGTEA